MVKKLKRYTNWLIEKGINGLFALGSFDGGPIMSVTERKQVCELIVEVVDWRISIICHIATNNSSFSLIYLQKVMNAVDKREFNLINGTALLMFPAIKFRAEACVYWKLLN